MRWCSQNTTAPRGWPAGAGRAVVQKDVSSLHEWGAPLVGKFNSQIHTAGHWWGVFFTESSKDYREGSLVHKTTCSLKSNLVPFSCAGRQRKAARTGAGTARLMPLSRQSRHSGGLVECHRAKPARGRLPSATAAKEPCGHPCRVEQAGF